MAEKERNGKNNTNCDHGKTHGCRVSARGTTAQGGEFNRIGVIKSHFYTIFPGWGRGK